MRQSVDDLIAMLAYQSGRHYRHAIRSFRQLGESAVREVCTRLGDGIDYGLPGWPVRYSGNPNRDIYVKALGDIGKVAILPLLEVLRDEEPTRREDAAGALLLIGDPIAFAPLCAALADDRKTVFEYRCHYPLSNTPSDCDDVVSEFHAEISKANDPNVMSVENLKKAHEVALEALTAICGDAPRRLRDALRDPATDVRIGAARALASRPVTLG